MNDNPDKFTVLTEGLWDDTTEKTYLTCSKCCYMGSRDVTTCMICGKIFCNKCLKIHTETEHKDLIEKLNKEKNVKNI